MSRLKRGLWADLRLAAVEVFEALGQSDFDSVEDSLSLEEPKVRAHGDFSLNFAMTQGKRLGVPPRQLAERFKAALEARKPLWLKGVEIAGPGFVNLFVDFKRLARTLLEDVAKEGPDFGKAREKRPQRVLMEYVSVNPTGPLHVGHGRGAVGGDVLIRVLEAAGYSVDAEYYVNDAGRQIRTLGLSAFLRLLSASGVSFVFPARAYQGAYLIPIAEASRPLLEAGVLERAGVELHPILVSGVSDPSEEAGEEAVSTLNDWLREKFSDAQAYWKWNDAICQAILEGIQGELAQLRVRIDRYFSEKSLAPLLEELLLKLKSQGDLYEKEGALWFKSTAYGDDQDRVVRRSDGEFTYFASDIAYHYDKAQRADLLIDIWGADHHGYIERVAGALTALGIDAKARFRVLLVQLASLYRGGKEIKMSTRADRFVDLEELVSAVGVDCARFYYSMHRLDHAMRFDVDQALSRSMDNPVYYVQYAHARANSVLLQAKEAGLSEGDWDYDFDQDTERLLIRTLDGLEDVIQQVAKTLEVQLLTSYAKEVALLFHRFYHDCRIVDRDDPKVSLARLSLVRATKTILANTLTLLGVEAIEKM